MVFILLLNPAEWVHYIHTEIVLLVVMGKNNIKCQMLTEKIFDFETVLRVAEAIHKSN